MNQSLYVPIYKDYDDDGDGELGKGEYKDWRTMMTGILLEYKNYQTVVNSY